MPSRSLLSLLPLLAAIACTGASGEPTSPDPRRTDAGTSGSAWRPAGAHTRENEGCRQVWTCDCGPPPAPGCTFRKPADAATTGVCASDQGPHASCTRCMALEPPEACACQPSCP